MRDSTSYADPGLKMLDTFALATVLTLKSDPELPLFKGSAQSVQPQVSTDLGYCKNFNPFYHLNCSAWERGPWRRVTEKSHFSTLNVGLAATENRTRATCMAGSVTRRSAIHYASVEDILLFEEKEKKLTLKKETNVNYTQCNYVFSCTFFGNIIALTWHCQPYVIFFAVSVQHFYQKHALARELGRDSPNS
jgi:hypothetical protein